MNRKSASEMHYVYLAYCANGTFYVGCTRNVEQRIAAHNAGRGGSYTRRNRPLSLVMAWPFSSQIEARQAERELKQLSHERKRALAESTTLLKETCDGK